MSTFKSERVESWACFAGERYLAVLVVDARRREDPVQVAPRVREQRSAS